MRIRTLLATTAAAAVTTTMAGVLASPADANQPIPDAQSGHLVTWGGASDQAAITLPDSLDGKQVVSVSIPSSTATGAVTADGGLYVWGTSGVVASAPTDVTDASAVALSATSGIVLEKSGQIVGWGTAPGIADVPTSLDAKAVAIDIGGSAYAVTTDGTLTNWGNTPTYAPPAGLSNLTDVVAGTLGGALDADGNVTVWPGASLLPGLAVPADLEGCGCVTQIATGGLLYGAIRNDGSVEVWGVGTIPDLSGLDGKKVVSLAIDNGNVIAVTDDGQVHTFGSTTDLTDLSGVSGINDGQQAVAVAAGNDHAVVIVTDFRAVTPPAISGSPVVGQTLTATPAELSLEPDDPATGQWLADGDEIAGQTGTTLAVGEDLIGKTISYRTTATRGDDTVTSTSDGVGPVVPATVASTTKLSVSPASAAIGKTRTVTATVTKTGGTPTGTVTFKTGSTSKAVALSGGKATWALPKLAVGNHAVTASYSGDATTDPSTAATVNVKVTKAASKVKAKTKVKKKAKKVKITITVNTVKGVSPKGKVTITVKGKTRKTVHAKVNAKGKATITVKKLKHGKYKATVKYAGNGSVKGSKTTKKFKA